MNAKECVSRGAALQCAMLSPVFKVCALSAAAPVHDSICFLSCFCARAHNQRTGFVLMRLMVVGHARQGSELAVVMRCVMFSASHWYVCLPVPCVRVPCLLVCVRACRAPHMGTMLLIVTVFCGGCA